MSSVVRCLVIFLFVLRPVTEADMFTTLADMENLLQTQVKIIRSLQHFVLKERKRVNFLETYMNRCKTEYNRAVENIPYYLGNPINAFTIIKRLSSDLDYVEKVIKDKTGYKRNMTVKFPSQEDLDAALHGFARIQTTYHLKISDLAKGIISGSFSHNNKAFKEVVNPLSASDCYYMGNVSFANDFFNEAIEWWIEALNKYETEGCDLCPFTEIQVMNQISQTFYILGDINNTIIWTNKKIALAPDDPETSHRIQFAIALKRKLDKNATLYQEHEYVRNHEVYSEFMDLCQGKANITVPFEGLKCMYASGRNPTLLLMRVKIEEMHLKPDIIMIHDIVSNSKMRYLLDIAKPQIWKNGSFSNIMKNSDGNYRNAKSVNLENVTSEVIDRVTRRLSLFTGMNMENSEPLKIINYGIGGVYETHYDCNTVGKAPLPFFQKYGDRISTIMIYLTNVAQGGATIFPALKLSVFPKKGAALFWMNLLPSGDRDDDIIHAACPVLRGSKWIAIKWPHEVPQKFCPIWRTKKGVMNHDMYHEFAKDVHVIRSEKRRLVKLVEDTGPLRPKQTRIRDEL